MKNITAMEKTTIEKTAMKRITTTALLLFLAFFSLTTCLIAQESGQQAGQTGQQARKQGWFVGVSPFSFIGTEIKTSRTTTTVVDTAGAASFEYEATIDSDDSVSNFYNVSNGRLFQLITNAEAKLSLIRGAIELCKRSDTADATTGIIEDTVPLDQSNMLNTKLTVRYYIGYYGGNLTGVDKTTEICDLQHPRLFLRSSSIRVSKKILTGSFGNPDWSSGKCPQFLPLVASAASLLLQSSMAPLIKDCFASALVMT